jgi:hypothetical protein
MSRSLLLFDTDRIKDYVFATDKLREIRAASAILDRLNRQDMMSSLATEQQVYANGGRGLFIVDTDRVQAIKDEVTAAYHQVGASITSADMEVPEDITFDTELPTELRILDYRLRAAKEFQKNQTSTLTHPYFNFCESCGTRYAEHTGIEDNQEILLCDNCYSRRREDSAIRQRINQIADQVQQNVEVDRGDGLWEYLIRKLDQRQYPTQGCRRPNQFTELADKSSPRGYIGLIYADGDAMGQQISQITRLRQMQDFAQAVDGSIYDATIEAICSHLQPKDEVWPFDILLLGGDDLVMVTRADSVLEVGLTVMKEFNELTQQTYEKNLSVSVGVAIAHANYPFGQLLQLGESALKFSKKHAAKRRQTDPDWNEGLLNFVVVSSANHLEFERFYQEQLLGKAEYKDREKKLHRSLRPYSVEDLTSLIGAIRHLKQLNTPRTKLEQLRTLLFQNKRQAILDSLALLFNWRSGKQRAAVQDFVSSFAPSEHGLLFPWFQVGESEEEARYFTPLLDLVEIYDFIN